nr:MAG TPA: nucelotide kinase [Caudoviricetes sp.]
METPEYYKYDDGETHFECFDISRYYSGDWAQVIQYVFRWQKKGGVEDLEKALACANDARDNGLMPKTIVKSSILRRAISNKFYILENANFSNACKVWEHFRMFYDATDEIIEALEEMIEDAEKA